MAKTLLESLQEKMQKSKKAPEQAAPGQTQAVQRLQKAGSGKAVGRRGAAMSSLGEKMARSQSDAAIGQIDAQQELQSEQQRQQSAEQTQATEQQRQSISQGREQTREKAKQKMDELMGDFERGKAKLDNAKDIADLEQAGFLARLSNQDYIANLQREGNIGRLENENQFREEMKRSVLDFMTEDLSDKIDFSRAVDADIDEFERQLAEIDIDFAMEMAGNKADSQAISSIYSGGTAILSSGLEYAEKRESRKYDEGEE